MASATYNMGRVVGFSAYEEFLRDYNLTPAQLSEQQYVQMCAFGLSVKADLKKNEGSSQKWVKHGTNYYTQIIEIPGAQGGVIPIFGLNCEDMKDPDSTSVVDLRVYLDAINYIYTCYVCDDQGNPVTQNSRTAGYIMFIAQVPSSESDTAPFLSLDIPIIIRGLGVEALTSGAAYWGPMGISVPSGYQQKQDAHDPSAWRLSDYRRATQANEGFLDINTMPIIDMGSVVMDEYYINTSLEDASISSEIKKLDIPTNQAFLLTVYNNKHDNIPTEPPALYAQTIQKNTSGTSTSYALYPVDCVAPYTLKMFSNGTLEDVVQVENAHTGVSGLFRNESDYVLWERSKQGEGALLTDVAVPVSDTHVENIYGMHAYMQRQFYFAVDGAHQYAIDDSVLEKVTNVCRVLTIAGYVDKDFWDTYVIPSVTTAYTQNFINTFSGIGDTSSPTYSYLNNIPEEKRGEYGFFVVNALSSTLSGASQDTHLIPIRKSDRWICFTHADSEEMYSSTAAGGKPSLNFTADHRNTTSIDKWDLMGSWWNGNKVLESGQWRGRVDIPMDGGGTIFLNNHPAYGWIYQDQMSYLPLHATPNPPSQFGMRWMKWFDSLSFSDCFKRSAEDLTGIHTDYSNMTLTEFFMAALTRDLGVEASDDNYLKRPLIGRYYIYDPSQILDIADHGWQNSINAKLRMFYALPRRSYFSPQPVHFNVMNQGDLGSEISFETYENAVWSTENKSGLHQTYSVALSDKDGFLMPLEGTEETVNTGYLTWSILLKALSNNQTIIPLDEGLLALKDNQFKLFSLKLDIVGGSADFYTGSCLDILTYLSPKWSSFPVMLGRISANYRDKSFDPTGTNPNPNWYQKFTVADESMEDLNKFIQYCNIGGNRPTIQINFNLNSINPSGAATGKVGAPLSSTQIIAVAYINAFSNPSQPSLNVGDGIIYFRNNSWETKSSSFSTFADIQLLNFYPDYNIGQASAGVWED